MSCLAGRGEVMLHYPGWRKGVKGNLFSLGGSEPLGLLIGLWTGDLAGPRQLLEVASHRRVL